MTKESASTRGSSNLLPWGVGLVALLGLVIYQDGLFSRLEALAGGPKSEVQEEQAYLPPQLKTVGRLPPLRFRQDYVPLHSRVYHAGGRALPLETTLVLRNPDPHEPIYFRDVDLVSVHGKVLRSLAQKPFELGPASQVEFLAPAPAAGAADKAGGHFRVVWASRRAGTQPLIEAVMVDERGHVALVRSSLPMRPPVDEPLPETKSPEERLARDTSRELQAEPPPRDPSYELRMQKSKEMRPKNP